ncbi:MAG TPA: hypothetical protein VN854_00060 [Mycoplasmatales bacterium]|nr:hypothetical protein [Mycoplasmatales bacterium]
MSDKVLVKSNQFWEYYLFRNQKLQTLSAWMLRSLKTRVLNALTNFYNQYHLDLNNLSQNTITSRYLKTLTLTLTKKRINLLMKELIRENKTQFTIFIFPEMHRCSKICHWFDQKISTNWSEHNRNLCRCFFNSKVKHWKCKRDWHLHGWQVDSLFVNKESLQILSFQSFIEKIDSSDISKVLSYNMKDWSNFYLYPREYREGALNFKKKWYWLLDSEKFLADKEKKKEYNANYHLKVSSQESRQKDHKLQKRKNLLNLKSKVKLKIKKLPWAKKEERKLLLGKLEKIKFSLVILKPLKK